MLAAKTGNVDFIKALLKNNVNIDAQNNQGQTALMFAVEYGHADCVSILLNADADVYIKNTFKDRLEGKDPQLEAAIKEIIK